MKIGSLFSGIGGLELGLESAGVGETVWQVECKPECLSVLSQHWPHAKRYTSIECVGAVNLEIVDLICGGFPCQDVSSAGSRAGLTGKRSGLWFQFLRVISELRPRWVVVENVESGADAWIDPVIRGLEIENYSAFPFPIAARDVGAPHIRQRVFIVACNANGYREPMGTFDAKMGGLSRIAKTLPDWSEPPSVQLADGISAELAMFGNAVVPQCAEVIGHVIRELEGRDP